MCRTSTKIMRRGVPKLLSVLAVAIATVALSGVANAQVCQHGLSCQIGVAGPDGNFNNPRAHIGDTINIVITAANADTCGDSLSITSIVAVVRHQGGASPSSSGNLLGAPATLPALGNSVTVNHTDVVQSGDQPVLVVATDIRGIDQGTTLPITATCEAPIAILVPCIEVTKRCVDATAPGQPINFDGTVRNCGNTTLNNVTVVDDHAGLVFGPATLAAGASATYSGSYIPTTCPSTNTVRAEGTDALGLTVSDTDSATCTIIVSPNVQITKVCVFNTTTGTIAFNGTVTNTGNVALIVTVNDDHAGTVFGPATLPAGASATYSGSYVPTTCPSTNRATVTSEVAPPFNTCTGGGARPTDSATATCGVPGTPSIDVTKACRLTGDCDNPTVAFNGTVTNTGDLPLTNVTVTDEVPGCVAPTVVLGPIDLAIGESRTFSGTYTMCTTPSTDTVRARGTSVGVPACGGDQTVTDTASCTVPVVGVPCIDVTKECRISGEDPSTTQTVSFNGTVRNCSTGGITLMNVTVTDSEAGLVLGPITLAPGATATYSGSYTVNLPACPFNLSFTDTVTARGEDQTICAGGVRVVTDTADCTVRATCEVVGVCRVTGGGRQNLPRTCPRTDPTTGRDIRYVTHGGQVGAPFNGPGVPDCATDSGYNNECIRGEWQHVRHMKGGLRGVFHARSNGRVHEFDSLTCACLPCDDFTTSVAACPSAPSCLVADRTYRSSGTTENGLCNPGDRECGPEPRRAPANKICFSGVGDWTYTKGRKDPQSVAFRVDIEDRSEPGGFHPKGSTPPPDRYRIRIWFLSGSADSTANKALRDAIACHDPLDERVLTTLPCVGGPTPCPNIDDGGDLDRGNHQIHPSTGARCN
jgi:uncharacterized repeat protein (TIGR01451 family)